MFSKFWFRKAPSKKGFESLPLTNPPAEEIQSLILTDPPAAEIPSLPLTNPPAEEIQSHPSTNPTANNPVVNSSMASRELSMSWRIENFSLLGIRHTHVESPQFSLRCGANAMNQQRFGITLHMDSYVNPDGFLQLKHLNLNLSRSIEKRLPDIRVSFSALMANGEYRLFHDDGLIRNGVAVENCGGQYEDYTFLVNRKSSHLPNDSLTFLLQFKSGEPVFEVDRLMACTRVPCEKVAFEWKIEHLPSSKRNGRDCVPRTEFDLELKTAQNSYEDVYEIFVTPIRCGYGTTTACDIYLKKDSGEREAIKELAIIRPGPNRFALSKEFCEKHAREALQDRGSLTLCFEFRTRYISVTHNFRETSSLEYIERAQTQTTKRLSAKGKESEANCPKNAIVHLDNAGDTGNTVSCATVYKNIYLQRIFSDFTLTVGDSSFPVHRCVLSAWSDVFRAMFEADMRERRESRSEVTDVDADTMDRMLRFLYSNEFQDLDEDGASRLLAAADKYQIPPLRSRCVDSLAAGLTAENVCRVLSLADKHSDRTLVARTRQFMFRNPDLVFQTSEWRRFMSENLEVASSLMHEAHLQRLA